MRTYLLARRLFTISMGTAVLFSSCRKADKSEIEKFREQTEDLSVERADNVNIRYTDSARLKAIIHTPELVRFPNKAEPYTEMPKGLDAQFYNPNGEEDSRLSANYGISWETKKLIKLTDSVRVTNQKGERLESEELFWNQEKKTIYTNKFVRIYREYDTIRGAGFESNETFTKYRILKPTGKVKMRENENEDEAEENR